MFWYIFPLKTWFNYVDCNKIQVSLNEMKWNEINGNKMKWKETKWNEIIYSSIRTHEHFCELNFVFGLFISIQLGLRRKDETNSGIKFYTIRPLSVVWNYEMQLIVFFTTEFN